MNKVIYFTTAQHNEDAKESLKNWKVAPNLSNQNFHNKMIRALSETHQVDAISVRPINKNYKLSQETQKIREDGNIRWLYPKVKSSKVDKALHLSSRIKSIAKDKYDSSDVVFVDTINYSLLKNAYKFAKKRKLKIIGICTDNPYNISFSKEKRNKKTLEIGSKLDGYISLTEKLDELFNVHEKRSLVIDGITEEITKKSDIKIDGDYIFFSGSLMHKYGVNNLITAFKNLNQENLKLVICGHHEEKNFRSFIADNSNIVYLGILNYDDVVALEEKALCAVNPRPIDFKIDEYSIPSKVLEYLANGVLTVSTDNFLLRDPYRDAIIWCADGEVSSLEEGLKKALELSDKERKEIKKRGKEIAHSRTSFTSVSQKIDSLFFE